MTFLTGAKSHVAVNNPGNSLYAVLLRAWGSAKFGKGEYKGSFSGDGAALVISGICRLCSFSILRVACPSLQSLALNGQQVVGAFLAALFSESPCAKPNRLK